MPRRNDNQRDEDHVGPAYPARYVQLGTDDTPGRRALFVVAAVILLGLIVVALIAS